MIIGLPKEIKEAEYRVASTPDAVKEFVHQGHSVLVEYNAGFGSGYSNDAYHLAGAQITDKNTLYEKSDMIYKVKEFFPEEFKYLREGLIVFTYIHSVSRPEQTQALLDAKVIGIAYEDVEIHGRKLLLSPMSELAGKGAFLAACYFMQSIHGGPGILLNDVSGQKKSTLVILGAGISGTCAAELAAAFHNRVILLDIQTAALAKAKAQLPSSVETLLSNQENISYAVKEADVLINCVHWPQHRRDHLVTRQMLKTMKSHAMIIDVSSDEGGAIETCRYTTHNDPIYIEEDIRHYCVSNIPSAYARTASCSLSNATFPYALRIANIGAKQALLEDPSLRRGLSFYNGKLTIEETGRKQEREYFTPEEVLGISF